MAIRFAVGAASTGLTNLRRGYESKAVRAARPGPAAIALACLAGSLLAGCDQDKDSSSFNFNGDARRGAALVLHYGCGGCHLIPDIANADGNVGPPLLHIGTRAYIAGVLHNSPENMSLWIQNPQKVLPGNAMPMMNIPSSDSRDITAFLYTLK